MVDLEENRHSRGNEKRMQANSGVYFGYRNKDLEVYLSKLFFFGFPGATLFITVLLLLQLTENYQYQMVIKYQGTSAAL
jgi:hypothetical protein